MARSRTRNRGAAGPAKPEFSRPVDVSRMGRLAHRAEIKANAEERVALAKRFDLIELPELAATLVLKKRGDDAPGAGVIEITGQWRARVAQRCVVTLEPVWSSFDEAVRLFCGSGGGAEALDPLGEEEWIEAGAEGAIDLGEAVVQLLAVRLDPYPRLPDAEPAPPR